VHFDRLERGSTVLVSTIEREAFPKVRERTLSVDRGDAPVDAQRAYNRINRLLREDNGVGALRETKRGRPILRFPGREDSEEKIQAVRQPGTLDGVVMRVGGIEEMVPVLLQFEGKIISGCETDRHTAKQLAQKLFEPVRVAGDGRWSRDAEGTWKLEHFRISSFEVLHDAPLPTALAELRSIETEWDQEAYDELGLIRHGPPGRDNGGH